MQEKLKLLTEIAVDYKSQISFQQNNSSRRISNSGE